MMSGAYRFPAMESVIYGRPFTEAVKEEVEKADAHAVFVLASGTLARETDLVDRLTRRARQPLRRALRQDRLAYPARRLRRRRQRRARRQCRPHRHPRRRFGDRRREDGRDVPVERHYRRRRSRQLPRPHRCRRQVHAAADQGAASAHDRHPDHPLGGRIHRLGRLHRHRPQRQGKLWPPDDDGEGGGARSRRHGAHARMAVPLDRHPRRRSRGRGHLLAALPAAVGGRLGASVEAARSRACAG